METPSAGNPTHSEDNPLIPKLREIVDAGWIEPAPGMVLGHYRLLEAIGEGGFAVVWRAENSVSNTTSALKIFKPHEFEPEDRLDAGVRFIEGTTAMQRLRDCDYVVRIHHGPEISNNYLWFAMEYIPEGDLSVALASHKLSDAERFDVVDSLITAITSAHELKIRHRDIRPQNILLRREHGKTIAVLADFDIAYYDHVLRSRKSTSVKMGVPRYWPTDVFSAGERDIRERLRRYGNDLYALCAVVFDLFIGQQESFPDPRSRASFRRLLDSSARTKKRPSGQHSLDSRRRNGLSRFLSLGLAHVERERFTTIQDVRSHWKNVSRESTFILVLSSVFLISLALDFGILADYAWGMMRSSPILRQLAIAVSSVLALVTGGGLAAWLVAQVRTRTPRWRLFVGEIISGKPKIATSLVVGAILVSVFLLSKTIQSRRRVEYSLIGAAKCAVLDRDGRRGVEIHTNDAIPATIKGDYPILECPFDGSAPVILPHSWLAHRVSIRRMQRAERPMADVPPPAPTHLLLVPDEWDPLSESEIRIRLVREIRHSSLLVRFINETFNNRLPSSLALFGDPSKWTEQPDETNKAAIVELRSRLSRLRDRETADDAPVVNAIRAHFSMLSLDCAAGTNYYVRALPEHPAFVRIWATDILRCLGRRSDSDRVREVTSLVPSAEGDLAGLLIRILNQPRYYGGESVLPNSAAVWLMGTNAEWTASRGAFVNLVMRHSSRCEFVKTALRISAKFPGDALLWENIKLLLSDLERPREKRGYELRRCLSVPELLREAVETQKSRDPAEVAKAIARIEILQRREPRTDRVRDRP